MIKKMETKWWIINRAKFSNSNGVGNNYPICLMIISLSGNVRKKKAKVGVLTWWKNLYA